MAEKTEITISGAGAFGELQPGWSINEDATPVAIGDSSGAIDSASFSVEQGKDSEFLISEDVELSHDDLGSLFGVTSSASSNGATESTNTNIPLSLTGVARNLTAERTSSPIARDGTEFAGYLPAGLSDTPPGEYDGHIATGPGEDMNVYRIEWDITTGSYRVAIAAITPDRKKTSLILTGATLPIDPLVVQGFAVTPTRFVLFYSSRLVFFDRTTGVLVNIIGSTGTGNSQFGSGANMQRIYWSPINNRVYVTDYGNNRVQVFSDTGTFVSSFAHPRALWVSGSKYGIYIADAPSLAAATTSITEYTFSNVLSRVFSVQPGYSFVISATGREMLVTSSSLQRTSSIIIYDLRFSNGDILSSMDSRVFGNLYLRSTLVVNRNFVYVTVSDGQNYQIAMIAASQATLYTIFAYCAALGGIGSLVSFEASINPILNSPGWTDTPWNKIKELAAAAGVEVAVVEGILVMRDVGTRTLDLTEVQGGSVSLGLSTSQGARSVLVEWAAPQALELPQEFSSGSVELLTGADSAIVGTRRATDVSNPFVSSAAQAYDRGIWRAEQLNGIAMQLNATVPTTALNGFGLTSGSKVSFKDCIYRITSTRIGRASTSITAVRHTRLADVEPLNAGRTAGQVDSFWAGKKLKDQVIKPLRDDANLYPYGAVGKRYYATADSFGTLQGTVVSYITLLANELGSTPYTNVSVGSRLAQDGAQEAWGNVSPVPYNLGADAFGHIAFGINAGLQAGLNPLTRAAEKGAWEQLIWAMCAESRLSNDDWSKWPTSWGVYSNPGLKDGSAYFAEAAGYQATITPPAGSYVGIGYSYSAAAAPVAGTGIWKRGSVTVQENDASKPPTTAFNNLLVPHPVRFMNMNGSTQISVDSVAGQYTTLDSLVKLSPTPPWVVVVKPTYIAPSSPHFIPNSIIDAYRSDIDSVVESVGNAYAPVARKLITVDPVTMGWNPAIHTSADGLHPNDLGAQFLRDCVKRSIAFAMKYSN